MAKARTIELRLGNGRTRSASALGNNAAWNCCCDRDTPMIGSLWIAREVSCHCGRRYRVVADKETGKQVDAVEETTVTDRVTHVRRPDEQSGADAPIEVHGVDWSGAVNAGKHAWWAKGRRDGSRLRLDSLDRGDSLEESGQDRDRFLDAVVGRIARLERVAVGFDFPFGLPAALLNGGTWTEFVASFPSCFPTPESFRSWCRERAGGRELKRVTDKVAKTPFAAYNLRLYLQTYFGIAGILAPLCGSGRAVAPPMQSLRSDVPWLLEVCPASTLKRLKLARSYKGRSQQNEDARRIILDALCERDLLAVPSSRHVAAMVEDSGGDALDAVVAAIATACAVGDQQFPRARPWHEDYRREAVVWF